MALIQHSNVQVRFDQQEKNSKNYVLPFIEKTHEINSATRVLEVGCAEGGVLKPFLDRDCSCVGVDLAAARIEYANEFLKTYVDKGLGRFITQNIYEEEFKERYTHYFDIIILKDVIEHVYEQEKFINQLCQFLRPGGQIFFGFPPWHMPFGGHQQICEGKVSSKLPYYHILPKSLYIRLLKSMGENEGTIQELASIWDTKITIGQFEKYVKNNGLIIEQKQHYLINPIYKYKFGLQARKQLSFIKYIPYLRNFVTTCVYYTVGLPNKDS